MTKTTTMMNWNVVLVRLFVLLSSVFQGASAAVPSRIATEGEAQEPSLPEGLPLKKPRIIDGTPSNPSLRTFFAKAGYDDDFSTMDVLCGATLISRDIAVTAAHCQGAFNYGLRILDAATNDYTRLVPVSQQIRHPGWDFDSTNLNFDVLVLKLETPLSPSDVAQPIPYNTDPNYPVSGQIVKGYGVGLTENNNVSPNLLEADFTYISNEECWGRGIQFNNVQQGDEVMCTDPVAGTSTCMGDSGGPLTDAAASKLLGIISFGSGCQPDRIPDGYVRMSSVADWVKEQICMISSDPPSGCPPPAALDPQAVEIALEFDHDFFSDQTTFAVRSRTTREIAYSGPTYTPKRDETRKSTFHLLPGQYTFEVYDTKGNGLTVGAGKVDGSWTLAALYDGVTETPLASGDAYFEKLQTTNFSVEQRTGPAPPKEQAPVEAPVDADLAICLNQKAAEESNASLFGTSCSCDQGSQLTCRNNDNEVCQPQYSSCSASSECCSGRSCRSGLCRETGATITERDDSRLGNDSMGGSANRRSFGNLRRR